jgi:kumamolisin
MGESHVVLAGSERGPMQGARALGATPEDEWLEVTVKLRRQAALPEPQPGQAPMTREALAKYGASAADEATVREALGRFGLEVIESDPSARTIKLGGTVAAMEEAFGTKLIQFAHERGEYRGRTGALHVPAALGEIIVGVFGLDNRRVVKERFSPRQPRELTLAHTTAARPWFFPAELAAVYDFPPGDGAGQTIGILEFGGGYFPDDLAKFCKAAQVNPPNVTVVSVNHASTQQRDGAEGEVMLDVEVVAGACPKASIVVYFSRFTQKGWVDVLDAAIRDAKNNPAVLSISWGDSEDSAGWSANAIKQVGEALQEAALLGITICVASGDDGSDDQVGDGRAHVDFPSSHPSVLAVGGTRLRARNGKTTSEVSWKDGDGLRKNGGGSTGGGVSVRFPRPAWQTASVPSVNPGGVAGRVVPDVAANASANTGYLVVVDGQASVSGGTSASAPLWAALIARINASLGRRVGWLTPLLYQASPTAQGKTLGAAGCRDISRGNNATAAVGGYTAHEGAFDAVTGWGVPVGSKLLADLQRLPPPK